MMSMVCTATRDMLMSVACADTGDHVLPLNVNGKETNFAVVWIAAY